MYFQDASMLGIFVANWRKIRERCREEWEGWKKQRREKRARKKLENDLWKAHHSEKVIACNSFLQFGD